jgi:hypothetical protein
MLGAEISKHQDARYPSSVILKPEWSSEFLESSKMYRCPGLTSRDANLVGLYRGPEFCILRTQWFAKLGTTDLVGDNKALSF